MLEWFRKSTISANPVTNGSDQQVMLMRKMVQFLTDQISTPRRAVSILSQIARFKELPPTYQERELPSLYLKIERHLVDEDPLQKFSRSSLRKTIAYRFQPLTELENFGLIFAEEKQQELLLGREFLKSVIDRAREESSDSRAEFLSRLRDWVGNLPDAPQLKSPLDVTGTLPGSFDDWIPFLSKTSRRLFDYLRESVSEGRVIQYFEQAYNQLAEQYRELGSFYMALHLLPDQLLDRAKIEPLNAEQTRKILLNNISALQNTRRELMEKDEAIKRAQEELVVAQDTALESVKLFHALLDGMEEAVVAADTSGNIILANQPALKTFGYSEEELVGQNIEILMPEKYREKHRQGMERYLKTRQSRAIGQRLALEGLRKDGSTFPLEVHLTETTISDRIYFTAAMRDTSANRKTEAEFQRERERRLLAEQRYQRLGSVTEDIVFTLSLDGVFTSLNSAFQQRTGLDPDEWKGKPFTQLIHQEDSVAALKLFQQVLQEQERCQRQVRIRDHQGKFLPARLTMTPESHEGRLTGVLGVARYESAPTAAQKPNEDEEANYRRLAQSCSDGVGICHNGKLIFLNKAGAQLLGSQTPRELVGKPLRSLFPAKQAQEALRLLSEVSDTPLPPVHTRLEFLRADEEELHAEVVVSPIIIRDKAVIQFVFRPEPQEEVEDERHQESAKQFQRLFESSPDAIFINDPDGFVLDVNPAACHLYGSRKEDLIGQSFLQRVPLSLRGPISQSIFAMAQNKAETFQGINLNLNGTPFPVELRASHITFNGKPAFLLIVRDISKDEQKEARLRELVDKLSLTESKLQETREKARRSTYDQERTAAHLQELLSANERLASLVPLCPSCKGIRDDQKFWSDLDNFAGDEANLRLIQGVCPKCAAAASDSTEKSS